MLKFLSGVFTGFVLVVVVVVCLFCAVPVAQIAGMAGFDMPEGTTIKDMSVVEAGKVAIDTVSHIDVKSFDDIHKTFGVDVFALVKKVIGIESTDTTIDSLSSCKISELTVEVQKLKVGDVLKVAKVKFDDNIKQIIAPMLDSSIQKITTDSSTVLKSVVDGIKISNIKAIDATLVPELPLFSDETKALADIIRNVETLNLQDFLVINESSPLIMQSLKDKPFTTIANDVMELPLNKVINIDGTPIKALASLANTKIKDLPDTVNNLKVSDVIDTTAPNTAKLLITLKDTRLADLGTAIQSLKTEDVIEITTESAQFLQSLKGIEILKLGEKIGTLKLGEIIKIDDTTSPKILVALKNSTLDSVSTDVNNIKVSDMVDITTSPILNAFKDDTLLTLGTNVQTKLSTVQLQDILVIKENTGFLAEFKTSTLSSIEQDVTNKLKVADLETLGKWGVFDTSAIDLTKTLKGKALGKYTITDLIAFLATLPAS